MVVKAEEWLDAPPGYAPGARVRRVMPEGSGTSGIMLVGEAAGGNEDAEGLPFRPWAEAGSVLERALWRAGVPRESLTITNVVCYRPPRDWLDGAPWEAEAIRFSRPMLDEVIARARPRAILALGGVAMRELTGLGYGEKEGILATRGFVVPALTARTPHTETFEDMVKWDKNGRPLEPTAFAPGGTPIPVVGTLHPSFLRRGSKDRQADAVQAKVKSAGGGTAGMALLGLLIRDIQLAKTVADGGLGKFTYDDYRLGATLDDWREIAQAARSDPGAIVSYDFETQDSLQVTDESEVAVTVRTVTQVQVSLRPGQALVSPWTPELLPLLREIIEGPGTKLDWNGRKFDRPLLRAMGIRTDLGRWVDGMDYWHHAQPDLPRGLQSAASFFAPEAGPWKHRSSDAPLWYGALDVDMPQRVYAGLRRTLSLTRHPVSGVSLDQGHEDQVVRVAPVLDRMTLRGIPVDEDRRVALDREFTATITRLTGEMQGLYPEELKSLHPPGGFVRTPVEFVHVCAMCAGRGTVPDREKKRRARIECPECHGAARWESTEVPEGWTKLPFTAQVKCVCDWAKNVRVKKDQVLQVTLEDCSACGNTGKVTSTRTRWARRLEFLPGSPDQVLRYIKHRRVEDLDRLEAKYRESARYADKPESWAAAKTAWKIPTNHKTGAETTGEAELRRLAEKTGDPLLPRVLEFREVAKMRGTYVEGWKPGADGRVHPGFGFKPATGQLSSDSPNAQNFPTHSELAGAMKAMIRAGGGKVMLKLDWKSFHLVTGSFEAQDADALRIARVDFHSFLTLVGLLRLERPEVAFAWSDDELRSRLQWWRKCPTVHSAYARRAYPAGMTFNQIRDALAKRVVYGWEFGQGPRSLYTLNQESFAGEAEARECQEALRGLFPRIAEWQKRVQLQADHDACLVSRHGFVRRFWDVFHRKPVADNFQPKPGQQVWVNRTTGQKWLLTPGDDAEAAIAFLPANDAFGIKRLALAELGARGWDEKFGLISETHDDFRFECPSVLADEALASVKGLMEARSKVLVDPVVAPDGLWCAVECLQGPSWAEMEEVKC